LVFTSVEQGWLHFFTPHQGIAARNGATSEVRRSGHHGRMDSVRLARLHEIVRAASEHVRRPPADGEESRPFEHYTNFIGDEGIHLGWELVAELRETAADLFASYSEGGLYGEALDVLDSEVVPPTVEAIATRLRAAAVTDEGPWLIVMPLANVSLGDRAWAPLGPCAAIQRALDEHRFAGEDPDERESEDIEACSQVRRHLGDQVDPASRTLKVDGTEIDTGRAASIIFKETGRPFVAIEAARAKSLYALATWAVLSSPALQHLNPDLANWTPQPRLRQRAVYKRFEAARWGRTEPTQGGDYWSWAPYDLPSEEVLIAPFEAFENLGRRSAQALLSSTAAIHAGGRASRSQTSERLRDVIAAVDCLCVPPPGVHGTTADQRWDRLAQRFGVWDDVARLRAYTPARISEMHQRLRDARDISVHHSEAALLDLGWNAGGGRRMRGRSRRTKAEDLALAAVHRDMALLLYAVAGVLRETWSEMRAVRFDDDAFEALFS
jgi:hypothetical protein